MDDCLSQGFKDQLNTDRFSALNGLKCKAFFFSFVIVRECSNHVVLTPAVLYISHTEHALNSLILNYTGSYTLLLHRVMCETHTHLFVMSNYKLP